MPAQQPSLSTRKPGWIIRSQLAAVGPARGPPQLQGGPPAGPCGENPEVCAPRMSGATVPGCPASPLVEDGACSAYGT
jgi:hypothetical protein